MMSSKKAAKIVIIMLDLLGWYQYCFTPLVGTIIDTPEDFLYAGIEGKPSPIIMVTYKQFGDPFQHKLWTASTTLAQLMQIESTIDPWDLDSYLPTAEHFTSPWIVISMAVPAQWIAIFAGIARPGNFDVNCNVDSQY